MADIQPPERKMAPVQGWPQGIPWSLHLEAYAAYCKKWSPQPALIEGWCRGGFGTDELDEFIPGWRERASENAALRDELERLTRELANARAVDIHSCHAGCTRAGCVNARLRERVKVLEDALRHIERVMGPKVPPCCDGCHYEWGEALKTVRAALGATP